MEYAIEIKQLGMVFWTNWGGKKRALENVSLEIYKNEIFGFLGHNGAGKTTTIKILVGLCSPTEGSAVILGKPLGNISIKNQIGFLPENISFYEYLTALETIEFYAHLHGISSRESKKLAWKSLEEVGLKEAAKRRVGEFSKGMRQRLGLAQAMVHDPEILILDEPLSGLDPVGRREIREKIQILKEQGKTIFFSSHVLADVERLCNRVALLSHGRLVAVGKLDDLLAPQLVSIEIVVQGLKEETLTEIAPLCKRILREGNKSTLWVETEENAQKLLHIFQNKGGILKALIPHRESLEDFYMRQTKGEKP